MHAPEYAHQLTERTKNFDQLEEVVHCMADNGADAVGQVGSNWVRCNGTNVEDIRDLTAKLSDQYRTAFHMAGLTLVDAARSLGAERIALNSVYYSPVWRDGLAGFLQSGGLNVDYAGNFVDLTMLPSQEVCNDMHWCFPGSFAVESVIRTAERAHDADVIVINGMPNFRDDDGLAERAMHYVDAMEEAVGKPVIASDLTLYWAIISASTSLSAKPGIRASLLTGPD